MATPDNDGLPNIERVTTGRRGPLAVAVLVAVMVGVLLWKPWDRPSPAPSLSPIAAVASPTPSPTAAPLPTPPPTASPAAAAVEIDVVSDRGRPFVECEYEPVADGSVLAQLSVGPPLVKLSQNVVEEGVRRVAWRAEIEVNELDTIFSADWTPVRSSRDHFAPDLAHGPLDLQPLTIRYDGSQIRPTAVVRVVVVVEWYGSRQMLGSRRVVVTTYGFGDGSVLAEGCHTFLG